MDWGGSDYFPQASPAYSDGNWENRRVQGERRFQLCRPWGLWLIAIWDIVSVIAMLKWSSTGIEAVKMRQLKADVANPNILTFSSIMTGISLVSQFTMGLTLVIGIVLTNNLLLMRCLRGYIVGSCVLLLLSVLELIMTVIILSQTYTNESLHEILGIVMMMAVRFAEIFLVLKILKHFNRIEMSSQVCNEQSLMPSTFRSPAGHPRNPQNPLNLSYMDNYEGMELQNFP